MQTRIPADTGVLPLASEPSGSIAAGRLVITQKAKGPLKCAGPLKMSDADGRFRERHDIYVSLRWFRHETILRRNSQEDRLHRLTARSVAWLAAITPYTAAAA